MFFLRRPATLLLAAFLAFASAADVACAQPPQGAASAAQKTSGVTPRDESSLREWLVNNGLVKQVSSRASELVSNAMSFLGVKYRYGGDSAGTGFDCSGFVRYVYQETLGMVLPHNAAQQSRMGEKIPESELRPGDLVFFNTLRRAFSHVGIYIGNGEFIHSPRPGQAVSIESLDSPYWARRFDGARRILTSASAPLDGSSLMPSAEAANLPKTDAGTDNTASAH